jgi:hypothetical protein
MKKIKFKTSDMKFLKSKPECTSTFRLPFEEWGRCRE